VLYLSIWREKIMAMKLVKKTDEYSIFKRNDGRYAVKDAAKNAVNGDEKTKVLSAEGLVTLSAAALVEEAPAEVEAPAEEAAAVEEAVEEAPAEESEDK
jgi:hypothetical protein